MPQELVGLLRAEVSRLREALKEQKLISAQIVEQAEADVSRLQQENKELHDLFFNGDLLQRERDELLTQRVKLLEENALLRRSLGVLTKTIEDKKNG